jgi:dTMP kinase
MRGTFITFEGPEGSGKSTHVARLAERLRGLGLEVVCTREPGGTRTGEMIREILQHDRTGEPIVPEAEVLLFAASRAQLVGRVIRPALERGAWVLCDRFADSTTVYQGMGRGFGMDRMIEISAFALGGVAPDLTLLLDVDVSAGLARMRRRNTEQGVDGDRFERETREFHERVREGYLALSRRFPERIRTIDATREPEAVAGDVWRIVQPLVPPTA